MAAVSPMTLIPAEIPEQINTVAKQIKQGEWKNQDGALADKIDYLISNLLTLNSGKEESAKILSKSCSSLEELRNCLPATIRTATLEAIQLMSQGNPLSSEQIARITQRLPKHTDAHIRQSISLFRRLKEILGSIWYALANWISYNRIPLSKLDLSPQELKSVIPNLTYLHVDSDLKMPAPADDIQNLLPRAEHLHTLKIETGSITILSTLPANLKHFECHSNSITTIIAEWPKGLETCDISQCENLEIFPGDLPNNLVSFNCSGNNSLESVPKLNPNLRDLKASYCSFQFIPSLPASVTSADFSGCGKIVEITSLPSGLTELNVKDCENLQEVNLSGPQNLKLYAKGASQLDLSKVPPQVTVIR